VVLRCFSNVVLQCVAIPPCGVAVISKPLVYDVCVFHSTVFIEMKFFAVLWFLVWPFSNLRSEIKETELSGWASSWKDYLSLGSSSFSGQLLRSVMFMDFTPSYHTLSTRKGLHASSVSAKQQ